MKDEASTLVGSETTSALSDFGDDSDDGAISNGEFRILTEALDDADLEAVTAVEMPTSTRLTSQLTEPLYGRPLSPDDAALAVPPGDDGLVRHAIVIPDKFCSHGKLISGLNKRDFDVKNGEIKPRRASLPITQSQLFTSLTKVDGPDGPRYIFSGVLNGWPSLTHFELIELEKKRSLGPLTTPDYFNSIQQTWSYHWNAEKEGKAGISPAIKDKGKIFRAKLRAAPWSSIGWSPESPGFMFWYESQHTDGPRVTYGLNAVKEVGDDVCTMVHMISHRYAMAKETARDKLTYHSIVFLEWDHGKFGTVVEGAYLNGIGGYKGKSNWYADKDNGVTELYKAMPPEMISPWLTTAAEIRCYDVPAKNLDELKEYITEYSGPDKRFVDPQYTFSHPARLTYRSKSNIAQYLVNYISRDCSYKELTRNCQTLTADICSFLAGKKDIVPYHPISRIDYHSRTHFFLYDSTMYQVRKTAHLKGKIAK